MIDSFDRIKLADAAPRGSEPPATVLTLEALLVDIDERAGYMPIDTRPMEAETPEKNRKPSGWLAAAVAFGVVLLFGGIIALTMTNLDSSSPPADGGETVTTVALTAEQQVRYDTALETIAVFNSGDIDAWMRGPPDVGNPHRGVHRVPDGSWRTDRRRRMLTVRIR